LLFSRPDETNDQRVAISSKPSASDAFRPGNAGGALASQARILKADPSTAVHVTAKNEADSDR
jgi:hypothetical protein